MTTTRPSIFRYLSPSTLLTLHPRYPTAVEKQLGFYPHRYTNRWVDFIYETKHQEEDRENKLTEEFEPTYSYSNVRFLQPPKLYEDLSWQWRQGDFSRNPDKCDPRFRKVAWYDKVNKIHISFAEYDIDNQEWKHIPLLSRSELLASEGRKGYSLTSLQGIAWIFDLRQTRSKREMSRALLRLYEERFTLEI